MNEFLRPGRAVDFDHPAIQSFLTAWGWQSLPAREAAERSYRFVRDEVAHSYDVKDSRVTVSASDALREVVGLCYSKSHLLAALLRGLGIPAAIRYQRLRTSDEAYCLHSFNAAWLDGSWHDLDARGNNDSVRAEFLGCLAFSPREDDGELTLSEHFAQPAESVLQALSSSKNALTMILPDRIEYLFG